MMSLINLSINIIHSFWKPISVWIGSLWVLLNIQFPTKDKKSGVIFWHIKKTKSHLSHYFYQELNLNYLMLKTNKMIFKVLSLLIWVTKVYIWGLMMKFFAFYKSCVSKSSNVFTSPTVLLLCFMLWFWSSEQMIDWLWYNRLWG